MGVNRVFLSQLTLDKWLAEGDVEVDGETLTLQPDGQQFQLKSAVHFVREVAGGGDEASLVDKVKDLAQIDELGAEHVADSVILGDNAYEVVEGFVGEPLLDSVPDASGADLADAARAAAGDERKHSGEIDLLARFFLSSSRDAES